MSQLGQAVRQKEASAVSARLGHRLVEHRSPLLAIWHFQTVVTSHPKVVQFLSHPNVPRYVSIRLWVPIFDVGPHDFLSCEDSAGSDAKSIHAQRQQPGVVATRYPGFPADARTL
jgi:hypothetical protein